MRERDARYLIAELLMLANIHDPDLSRSNAGAVSMSNAYPRPGQQPTTFHTSCFLDDLFVKFETPNGPRTFRLDITEVPSSAPEHNRSG